MDLYWTPNGGGLGLPVTCCWFLAGPVGSTCLCSRHAGTSDNQHQEAVTIRTLSRHVLSSAATTGQQAAQLAELCNKRTLLKDRRLEMAVQHSIA